MEQTRKKAVTTRNRRQHRQPRLTPTSSRHHMDLSSTPQPNSTKRDLKINLKFWAKLKSPEKVIHKERNTYLELIVVLHLDTVMIPCNGWPGVGHDCAVKHQGWPILILSNCGLGCEGRGHAINLSEKTKLYFKFLCIPWTIKTTHLGLSKTCFKLVQRYWVQCI